MGERLPGDSTRNFPVDRGWFEMTLGNTALWETTRFAQKPSAEVVWPGWSNLLESQRNFGKHRRSPSHR